MSPKQTPTGQKQMQTNRFTNQKSNNCSPLQQGTPIKCKTNRLSLQRKPRRRGREFLVVHTRVTCLLKGQGHRLTEVCGFLALQEGLGQLVPFREMRGGVPRTNGPGSSYRLTQGIPDWGDWPRASAPGSPNLLLSPS